MLFRRVTQAIRAVLAVAVLVVMLAPISYVQYRDVPWDWGPHEAHAPILTTEYWLMTYSSLVDREDLLAAAYAFPVIVVALLAWEIRRPRGSRGASVLRLVILLAAIAGVAIGEISATLFGEARPLIGQETLWLCMLGLVVGQALALRKTTP